jgi:hypothetical protein
LIAYCNYLKGNYYQVASYKNPNVVQTSFFSFLLSNIYKNKFPAPFWPLFTKFSQNSAIKFFWPTIFFPAPFELFGREFGHLAALRGDNGSCPHAGLGGGGVNEES